MWKMWRCFFEGNYPPALLDLPISKISISPKFFPVAS